MTGPPFTNDEIQKLMIHLPVKREVRVLLAGDWWRIVRVTNTETAESSDVVEIIDGHDLLGAPRWTKVEGRDAVSTYVKVMTALVHQLTKDME